MRLLLTDRFCARAKTGSAPQTDYFDETVKGLALRVGAKRKTWTLHLTVAGKRQRLTLGSYPSLSLAGARAKALTIAEGGPLGGTFKAISDEFMRRTIIRTKRERQQFLDRLIYPTLGNRPIAEIRRSEIVRLLDRIEDESSAIMADHCLAIIRRVMNWHASRSDDFRSPIVRGMARTKPHERARERTLTDDELRSVWRCAEGEFGRYLKFVLLTACRRTEALNAHRSEIDGDDWIIPGARYKTGKDHLIPLSRAAQALAGEGEDRLFALRPGNIWRYKDALSRAAGIDGDSWTVHDCRCTARSLMSRAGVSADVAERALGHVVGGVRGTYDRHEYFEEKRLAFEKLAALIGQIVDPQPNVVSIRAAAINKS
jgi:integrase